MRGYNPAVSAGAQKQHQNYNLPERWHQHVSENCRVTLSDAHRREIAHVLWSIHHRKKHRTDSLAKSIGFDELDARFGTGQGYAILAKSGFFQIGDDWKKGKKSGYTREIKLTDHGQKTLDRYFDSITRKTRIKPQTTAPTRHNFNVKPQVQINVDAVKALAASTDDAHQRTAANQLTHCSDDGLIQYYTEHRGGRLFIHGAANLQNAPSDVRDAALAGFYDYDLKNCYPTIYGAIAERLEINTPVLNYYLTHRDELLNEIAAQMKCNAKQCKASLLALMHFAGVDGIIEATGKRDQTPFTEKQAKRFLTLSKVKRIRAEFRRVGNAWIAECLNRPGRYLVNDYGKGCERKLPARKLISHLLQGVEAIAIETVRDTCGDQIALLMHDGFVCEGKINQKYIEGKIRQATGIRFTLKCTQITSEFHIIKPTCSKPLQTAPLLAFRSLDSNLNLVKGGCLSGGWCVCGGCAGCGCGCFASDRSVLFKPILV